ncbi:mitochondrial ribosomal protein S30 [Oratosquilla oratoria]|uniref:mitochondrial ribosomal protein S30 n=1 Tax=Oratosquilla oratoria TaxID=337810 RepID=UPI003F7573C8
MYRHEIYRKLFRSSSVFKQQKIKIHSAVAPTEYDDEPMYPPILDMSPESIKRRKKESWHDKITKLPTIEQKMVELNMPKYYGYWSCQLHDEKGTLNGQGFTKYATRTHVTDGLPSGYYEDEDKQAAELVPSVQSQIEELIKFHYGNTFHWRNTRGMFANKRQLDLNFLQGLQRIMISSLSPQISHLRTASVDVQPRIEAFWFLGGIQPDLQLKKIRKNCDFLKDKENDPIDRPIQCMAHPTISIRSNLGLPEVVSMENSLATDGEVPVEQMDPRAYGFYYKHSPAVTLPGFWPGEVNEHGLLFFHTRYGLERQCLRSQTNDMQNVIMQKLILASFTQASSFASYFGFGPVSELTYPFVQQNILTDGQNWNFSVYQLNTCALHSERAVENPVNNILWVLPEMQLFEAVDETGVKGLNTEVLQKLIAMYIKEGVPREDSSPYLANYKYLANHEADGEMKEEFRKQVHHVLSKRKRHLLKDEVYLWEKIYKIDFNTRALDAKRRFFEKHWNQKHPGSRRLDDHMAVYVPKALRKEPKKKFKPYLHSEKLFSYDKD